MNRAGIALVGTAKQVMALTYQLEHTFMYRKWLFSV